MLTTQETVSVPSENGKNRYGLDMAYFRDLFNRELNRPLVDYRPDELARVLVRAARSADASVLQEPEFFQPSGKAVAEILGHTMRHAHVDQILDLAAFIRQVNGNNDMGSANLAEGILDWQATQGLDADPSVELTGDEFVGAVVQVGLQDSFLLESATDQILIEIKDTCVGDVFEDVLEDKPPGRYAVVFLNETEYPDPDCIGSPYLIAHAQRAVPKPALGVDSTD